MTTNQETSFYTRQFWAKAKLYRQREPEHIHLLEHRLTHTDDWKGGWDGTHIAQLYDHLVQEQRELKHALFPP